MSRQIVDLPGLDLEAVQPRPRVLVVDEDESVLREEADVLRSRGYLVEEARSIQEAVRVLYRIPCDALVTDLDKPSIHGMLPQVREIDPSLPVLVSANPSDLAGAIEAVNQGAYDYVTRPSASALLVRVRKAVERRRLTDYASALYRRIQGRDRLGELVGRSTPMQRVYQKIDQSASCTSRVLILGEPGTGKELVAREIHARSMRQPFRIVRCADRSSPSEDGGLRAALGDGRAVPTGSNWLLDGRGQGTLFLDEVQQLSIEDQAWLVRALEAADAAHQVPGSEAAPAVRLIAASTALDEALENNALLADLYCLLSEIVIHVPTLRERVEDAELLSAHILQSECRRLRRPLARLSPRSLELLTGHDWPGNVEELQTLLHAAVADAKHRVIMPGDLAALVASRGRAWPLPTMEEVETAQIEAALTRTLGNRARAARMLGIPRSTFYRKVAALKRSTGSS